MTYTEGNYIFGRLKQKLQVDQRIVMGRTTDPNLDGKTGVILGRSWDASAEGKYTSVAGAYLCDFYIILLDEPIRNAKAITLTEACICPISEISQIKLFELAENICSMARMDSKAEPAVMEVLGAFVSEQLKEKSTNGL